MTRVVALLNQKGGVGKTTTAINLGAYLARAGKKVLIIDFDPQGNATSGVGLSKDMEVSSYDILFQPELLSQAIQETQTAGLYVIGSNAGLAAAEVQLVERSDRELVLKKTLSNGLDYDFVLIDCPPALGLLTINALAAADQLLIPVQAEYYALEGLGQLLSIMQRVRQGLNPQLELLGVLVTMYDGRTSLSEQVYNELQKHFGDKVFKTIIPRNVRLAEAPSHGKPIADHDKWSKGARAYKQLTKEVLKRVEG